MASHPPIAERIEIIADMMRRCVYQRGKTDKHLAREWGLSLIQVQDDTSEASRRAKAEIANENYLDATVDYHLENALMMATESGDPSAVAKVAATWAAVKRAGNKHVDFHGVARAKIEETIIEAAAALKARGEL